MRIAIDFDKKVPNANKDVGAVNLAAAGWLYGAMADRGYSRQLHDVGILVDGTVPPRGGLKQKPYVFSIRNGKRGARMLIDSMDSTFLLNIINGFYDKPLKVADVTMGVTKVATSRRGLKYEMAGGKHNLAKAQFFCLSPFVLKAKNSSYMTVEASNNELDEEKSGEDAAGEIILNNALAKYKALTGRDIEKPWMKVWFHNPIPGWTKVHNNVVRFNNSHMTVMTSAPELLHVIYTNGLGCKNGLGFGMVEIHNPNKIKYNKMEENNNE